MSKYLNATEARKIKFVVNCIHDETDFPSVVVSWKEVVDYDCD